MDAKTQTWMMSPEGIKALWDRFDRFSAEMSMCWSWLAEMSVALENAPPLPIIASPTPTAPTMVAPSDVAAESTTPMTPPSSQSGQPVTESGPVEPPLGCAHDGIWWGIAWGPKEEGRPALMVCGKCRDAYKWSGKILVPAADPTSSTSPKQGSSRYAGVYREASAPSRSNDWTRCPLNECKVTKGCCWLNCEADAVSTGGARG